MLQRLESHLPFHYVYKLFLYLLHHTVCDQYGIRHAGDSLFSRRVRLSFHYVMLNADWLLFSF
jgi:hypothetical protein